MKKLMMYIQRSGSNIFAAVHRSLTLNGKGGRIMKKPIVWSSSLFLLLTLLVVTFMAAECEKPEIKDPDSNIVSQEDSVSTQDESITSWRSILAPDVTLTLTIDQLQRKMYVSTDPPFADYSITGRSEMLHHGRELQYRLVEDTMFLILPHVPDSTSCAWIKTMLPPDSMQLDYWGFVSDDLSVRTCYLFRRIYAL
ncbi:MAG: hypothetical protein LBK03_05735 [Bacteroidales bacterium]|jgi:hypothetical protein|nr:hypothetical protein [Bacteroidales bacterium]